MTTDFSRDELEVLAGARRALAPNAQDAARVLHNARLAIASGAVGAAGASGIATVRVGMLRGPLLKKVALSLVVAGGSAWLGYRAGYGLGERDALARSTREQQRSAPVAERPAPTANEPAGPGIEPPVEASRAIVEAPVAARRRAKATAAAVEPAVELATKPATDAPLAPHPNASLDAEVKALRRIERALRNREPQQALDLLAQLDRDVVDGQMLEERAAARAMARCEERAANGTPNETEVMQRVLEFSQRYPASVYFARVRQTCLATLGRESATDSAPR